MHQNYQSRCTIYQRKTCFILSIKEPLGIQSNLTKNDKQKYKGFRLLIKHAM